MDSNGLSFDSDGVFSSDAGTGRLDLVPCPVCCKVFRPPRKSRALLRANLVNGTSFFSIEKDAHIIALSTLKHIRRQVFAGSPAPTIPQRAVHGELRCVQRR